MSGSHLNDAEQRPLTVSELTVQVKRLLEREVGNILIRGELSNFRVASSGHAYGTLKDSRSQVRIVVFRNTLGVIGFLPDDGMEVLVRGRVTVYEARGDYQIVCDWLQAVGAGAAALALLQLKERLAAEGLFDPDRKRSLPFLPMRIGLVTSPTGAAVRDVLRVLTRRYANLHVLLSPSRVQGADAPGDLVSALRLLGQVQGLDVILLTRGGGAAEDLTAFNHETVVRAISATEVPVVSAIGHEIDWTLSDLAADLRASTPSAAAELIVREKATLEEQVRALSLRLIAAGDDRLSLLRRRVGEARRRLLHPRRRLEGAAQRLDDLGERVGRAALRMIAARGQRVDALAKRLQLLSPLSRVYEGRDSVSALLARARAAMRHHLAVSRERVAGTSGRLETLSPLAVLERGYSITRTLPASRIVRSPRDAPHGTLLEIRVQRGDLRARVEIAPDTPGRPSGRREKE